VKQDAFLTQSNRSRTLASPIYTSGFLRAEHHALRGDCDPLFQPVPLIGALTGDYAGNDGRGIGGA